MSGEWARIRDTARGLLELAADQLHDRQDELATSAAEAIWGRAFSDLSNSFYRLCTTMDLANWGTAGCGGTSGEDPEWPLHWYGSVSKGSKSGFATIGEAFSAAPDEHEVTISADFQQDLVGLRYTSDLSADGRQVRQGPTGVMKAPHRAVGSYPQIKTALREIGQFIADSGPLIEEFCRQEP